VRTVTCSPGPAGFAARDEVLRRCRPWCGGFSPRGSPATRTQVFCVRCSLAEQCVAALDGGWTVAHRTRSFVVWRERSTRPASSRWRRQRTGCRRQRGAASDMREWTAPCHNRSECRARRLGTRLWRDARPGGDCVLPMVNSRRLLSFARRFGRTYAVAVVVSVRNSRAGGAGTPIPCEFGGPLCAWAATSARPIGACGACSDFHTRRVELDPARAGV